MKAFVYRNVSFMRLLLLFVLLFVATAYLFNPSAEWNKFFEAGPNQAPEFQPQLNRDAIFNFFAGLSASDQNVYLFYEGVADTAYFILQALFALCILGLAGKYLEARFWSSTWMLAVPIVYLIAEIAEGIGLLLTLQLVPSRIEPLLLLADVATLLKMTAVSALLFLVLVATAWLAVAWLRGKLRAD